MILLLINTLGILVIFKEVSIENLRNPGWAVTAATEKESFSLECKGLSEIVL